jgi:glycerol-3-phosphate dehydrogenase (NAD(P)+)
MKAKKVSVLVAGSWGTALASVLAANGSEVCLWTRNESQAEEINNRRTNGRFLKTAVLDGHIRATTDMREAAEEATAIVFAATSASMRDVARQLRPHLHNDTLLIHATKGFEIDTLKRMTDVIAEELPDTDKGRIVVLSGPSHAEEVVERCPTTVVVAAENAEAAEAAQDLFINSYFRVYTNPDVIGVEVGGALKNIIALGAGMSDGIGFGDNAKAALMTRGLAEIARFGASMGAHPMTFAGLAGIGDLIVTCTSKHSRNWKAGYMLGQGKPLAEVLETMGMVVEGVRTTKAAHILAGRNNISMPITAALYDVLFDGKSPKTAVEDLMGRDRTYEIEEVAKPESRNW